YDVPSSRFYSLSLHGALPISFDAQYYLDMMDMPQGSAPPELEKDTVPKVTAPWRRFFAREIDLTLYSLLWSAFMAFVIGVNIGEDRKSTRLNSSHVSNSYAVF